MKSEFDWLNQRAQAHIQESGAVMQQVAETCTSSILDATEMVIAAFRAGGKVLLCGNGGSAADCQHMAAELIGQLTKEFVRPPLPAIALTTDTSFLTAYANDFGYEGVFERQVQALGRRGDVLIGFSTSGNSINVVRAVKLAQKMGIATLCLTGSEGTLTEIADNVIAVPSKSTQYIQEAHSSIIHILCDLIERSLFAEDEKMEIGRSASAVKTMFAQTIADSNTHVRVCVAAVVRDQKRRILLEKRQDCGLWGFPGGKIEPGESVTQTAIREIMEETGFHTKITRLLGIYSAPRDRIVTYPDNIVQIVDILLEAEIISGELAISLESKEMKFFALSELPSRDEVIPPARLILEDIVQNKIGVVA